MNTYIIKAPDFSGFYGYDLFSELSDLSNIEYDYPEIYEKLHDRKLIRKFQEQLDDLVDWDTTCENISKNLADNVYYDVFCKWVENSEFFKLWGPKEYNFRTDEIELRIELTDKQLSEIEVFCFGEKKREFDEFLRDNYSSYSGFISFIPNNIDEFKKEYWEHRTNKEEGLNNTFMGVLFHFLYVMDEDYDSDDYVSPYSVEFGMGSIYEHLTWKEDFDEVEIANELIKEFDENKEEE